MKKIMENMVSELEEKVHNSFINLLKEHDKVKLGFTDNMPTVNYAAKVYVDHSIQLHEYKQEMKNYDTN